MTDHRDTPVPTSLADRLAGLSVRLAPKMLTARHVVIDDFVPIEVRRDAIRAIDGARHELVAASTTNGDVTARQAWLVPDDWSTSIRADVEARVRAVVPDVAARLGIPAFEPEMMTSQLTAFGDRSHYQVHTDTAGGSTATRKMTFVCYLHDRPRRFSGGQLRIWDTDLNDTARQPDGEPIVVEPTDGSVVFFDSRLQHEVTEVRTDQADLLAGRFTINGWVR